MRATRSLVWTLCLWVAACGGHKADEQKPPAAVSPAEADVGLTLTGPSPSPDDYGFGHGGDLTADGLVDDRDLQALRRALDTGAGAYPEFDVDRDGELTAMDLRFVEEVIAGERAALLAVDFVESDVETGDPAYIEAQALNIPPETMLLVGDETWAVEPVEDEDVGVVYRAYLAKKQPPPADGTLVSLTGPGVAVQALPLTTTGEAPGQLDESASATVYIEDGRRAPPVVFQRAPDPSCCFRRIRFTTTVRGLKIVAYDASGNRATGSGRTVSRNAGSPTTLTARTRTVVVQVFRGRENVPAGQWTLDCETFANIAADGEDRRHLHATAPATADNETRERGERLLTILDAVIERPCEQPAPSIPAGMTGGTRTRDNEKWTNPDDTDEERPGSGGITTISIPRTSITDRGCNAACWTQAVATRIELQRAGEDDWSQVHAADWHNDNLEADPGPNGEPWYCYGAQFERDGNLVLGDGPHLVHSATYWFGGRRINMNRGDKVRRQSFFLSSLICYDPTPETVLASFFWTITTEYTHNPDDLESGGATTATPPTLVNLTADDDRHVADVQSPVFRKGLSRKTLRKHLRKKERDRRRCP